MIPQELKDGARWCVWKREVRGGKPTKVPYNALTNKRAETNDPSTFCAFELADEAYMIDSDYNGIGILVGNGFTGIDIDHCVTDGEPSDFAVSICEMMRSYTEFSPSKTGLRIILQGEDLAYDRENYYLKNPNNGVELYVSGMTNRFLTITGNTLFNYPVRRVTSADLEEFLDKYMRRKAFKAPETLTDDQIIAKASQSEKFCALFRGDTTAYNNDHSSADLALCNILAFWTGKDEAQMDRVFRKSGLYREKWERSDYRNNTIQCALRQCTEVYDPARARKIWDRLNAPVFDTGTWTVDNSGIYREATINKRKETVYATSTPIAPVAYLENHSEGIHKVELHYLCNGTQRSVLCERETIASKNKILSLANYGINVTSNDAAELVRYLSDIERLNPRTIPHYKSVSCLGWVDDDFVPYNSKIKFDGDAENRALFKAVAQAGDYAAWVDFMRPLRKNLYFRLMMAAAFASPLIERVNTLPFVFHLWGETGKGKTVALMAAMSIWGDPRPGKLTRTMNMTNAAMMSTAAFLNNLPFAGDELQTIKDAHTSYDKLIMQITEGIERGRMQYNKNLPTRRWNCAFLFTGEERCTNDKSGGGTQNRVFEVEFEKAVVENGAQVVRFISKNYGHAGRKFIEHVTHRELTGEYDDIREEILESCKTTDKQAATAALILLADRLACESIFTGESPLRVQDIAGFIKDSEEVIAANRAYDYIVSWVAMNANRFCSDPYGEIWGVREGANKVYVIDSVLANALETAGFSFDAVKKAWAQNGWLVPYRNKYKKRKSFCGITPYCVEIMLPDADEVENR